MTSARVGPWVGPPRVTVASDGPPITARRRHREVQRTLPVGVGGFDRPRFTRAVQSEGSGPGARGRSQGAAGTHPLQGTKRLSFEHIARRREALCPVGYHFYKLGPPARVERITAYVRKGAYLVSAGKRCWLPRGGWLPLRWAHPPSYSEDSSR